MRIAVLLKVVPDTSGDRAIDLETGLADRTSVDAILDEIGERSVEAALRVAENVEGAEIELLSMTPEEATGALRKGLAMGAASAVQVVDSALLGADHSLTAEVLAAAIRRGKYDLVIAGNESTDGSGGVVPTMIAELLDLPQLTELTTLDVESGSVRGTRASDDAVMTLSAELPAIVSITEVFPDARFPNFKGIMAAKKKPFEVISVADLGVDAEDHSVPRNIMTAVTERAPREAGETIVDEGDAAEKIADFLVKNRLV